MTPSTTFQWPLSPSGSFQPLRSFPFKSETKLAGPEGAAVSKAIEIAFGKDSGSGDIGIEVGEAGSADGDVLLRVAKGRLWFVRPDRPWNEKEGSFGETPSVAIGTDLPLDGRAFVIGYTIQGRPRPPANQTPSAAFMCWMMARSVCARPGRPEI